MAKKTHIPSATMTYIGILNTADQIRAMLEVLHTQWMPKKLRTVYERMIADARELEKIADKLANIEYGE